MASAQISSRYGSPAEIAAFLSLSVRTVRRLYSSGKLRYHQIDRRVLIAFSDAEFLVRRSIRNKILPPAVVPSSVSVDGRAVAYSEAESRARVRVALATLDDLANDSPEDEPDQVEALARLSRDLRANRGEG